MANLSVKVVEFLALFFNAKLRGNLNSLKIISNRQLAN